MYAIVEMGGRQWKVEPGTRLEINRLSAEVGAQHKVERVLLAHDGTSVQIGSPYVSGVAVVCEVLEHHKGPKIISYHFRRRENWRKTVGHRQPMTRLVVKDILFGGQSAVAATAAMEQPEQVGKRAAPEKVQKIESPKVKPKAAAKPRTTKKAEAPEHSKRASK